MPLVPQERTLFGKVIEPIPFGYKRSDFYPRLHLDIITHGPPQFLRRGALAKDIYAAHVQGKPLKEAKKTLTQIHLGLNDLRGTYKGKNFDRGGSVMVTIMNNLVERTAMDNADQLGTFQHALLLIDEQRARFSPDVSDNWYFPQLINLRLRMESWMHMYAWMDALKKSPAIQKFLEHTNPQDLERAVVQLRESITQSRGSGVANGVFQSPLLLPPTEAFTVYDSSLGVGNLDPIAHKDFIGNRPHDETLALLVIGKTPKPTDTITRRIIEIPGAAKNWHVTTSSVEDNAFFRVEKSGQIFSSADAQVLLSEGFQKKGALAEG